MLRDFQPVAAIATTPQAVNCLKTLCEIGVTLYIPESIAAYCPRSAQVQIYQGALKDQIASLWQTHRSLIFGLATGAVVRLIAPLLQDKATDPAVLVMDAAGQFVISLCGGHQGGADQLTRTIAQQLGATPILTGGANDLNLPGIDVLGIPFGWQKGTGDWTGVSAAIARQEPIQVMQEAGLSLWQQHLPNGHSFYFQEQAEEKPLKPGARIWISPIQRQFSAEADFPKVQWHPRVLWVGVGCERGTSRQLIESAIRQVCRAAHLAEASIAGIATIDIKADEQGILELCDDRQWALRCFPAELLKAIEVPTPSEVVNAEVGTPSVAEAAALLAATPTASSAPHLSSPTPYLRVAKKIIREEGQPGAVTIAIAQSEQEYTGRTGQLWLVGIGPGQLNQITPAAKSAIVQADVLIGYGLYIDLIRPLLRPGQIVETLPITQERQRAERAIELAQWGLTVAVISSGDCGIYGMAGLVMEQLRAANWDGTTPGVQVFPGITALQAVASRVGAPLMHDFCAISLSDLLTPWTVIEQRLAAAAQADFVTALYNPRSQTRTHQITTAQEIFLKYRDPETPVAVVRSVYRPDEQIMLTTLGELHNAPIDMLTTVLIGNQSTRTHENWMITPRGYLGFGEGKD